MVCSFVDAFHSLAKVEEWDYVDRDEGHNVKRNQVEGFFWLEMDFVCFDLTALYIPYRLELRSAWPSGVSTSTGIIDKWLSWTSAQPHWKSTIKVA